MIFRLQLSLASALLSFSLLALSIYLYPEPYALWTKTISSLGAIDEGYNPSAISLPISHFFLASSIILFSLQSPKLYQRYSENYNELVRYSQYFGISGALCILIAALTPHGIPTPFKQIHWVFAVAMFPLFAVYSQLVFLLNVKAKGWTSLQTLIPLVFFAIFMILLPIIYWAVENKVLPNAKLIPTLQKTGYGIFILGVSTMLVLIIREERAYLKEAT